MPRAVVFVPLLLLVAFNVRADEPRVPAEVRALQATLHRVIDEAEPAIACVAVSRSERYKDFGPANGSDQPGKLGSFDARPFIGRFESPARKELAHRLDLSDLDNPPEAYGSGVVIDPSGLVLTHFHVVRDATKVYVRLPGGRGSYADIHAADGRSDLAVLRLISPPVGLKTVRLGDGGKARKGDWVVSMANPFAAGFRDGSASAAWGIIANVRRRAPGTPREVDRTRVLHHYGTLIQTDARLNLGTSGGALLNLDGEVIGLTTALAAISGGETSGGYAVPMTDGVRRIVEILRRGEEVEYGFLGVSLLPDDNTGVRGVMIREATPGLPAARAGLTYGDTILSINGTPIREYEDLFLVIGSQLAGSEARLQVRSPGGGVREVTVVLAKMNHTAPFIASQRPRPVFGLRVDYTSILLQDASAPMPEGVLVKELVPGSPADAKIKPQQEGARVVVTRVNGKPVLSPRDFYRAAAASPNSVELQLVDLVRNATATSRTVKLP